MYLCVVGVFTGFASPWLVAWRWAGGFTKLGRGSGKCRATTGMTYLQRVFSSHLEILAFLFCVAHLFQPFHRQLLHIPSLLPLLFHTLAYYRSVSLSSSRLDQVTVWWVMFCLSVRSKYPFSFLSVHLLLSPAQFLPHSVTVQLSFFFSTVCLVCRWINLLWFLQIIIRSRLDQSMEESLELKVDSYCTFIFVVL